jgi:hypothetical protein
MVCLAAQRRSLGEETLHIGSVQPQLDACQGKDRPAVVQFAATVKTGTHVLVEGASGHGNCCFEHSTIREPLNIQLEQIRESEAASQAG